MDSLTLDSTKTIEISTINFFSDSEVLSDVVLNTGSTFQTVSFNTQLMLVSGNSGSALSLDHDDALSLWIEQIDDDGVKDVGLYFYNKIAGYTVSKNLGITFNYTTKAIPFFDGENVLAPSEIYVDESGISDWSFDVIASENSSTFVYHSLIPSTNIFSNDTTYIMYDVNVSVSPRDDISNALIASQISFFRLNLR